MTSNTELRSKNGSGGVAVAQPPGSRLSDEQQRQVVARKLQEMRAAWGANRHPLAEEFLATLPDDLDEQYVVDLIYQEFLLRQEYGRPASASSFLQRFPQHGAALERQWQLDDYLETDHSNNVDRQSNHSAPTLSETAASDSSSPATTHPLFQGDQLPRAFGKYVLVAPLGRGGQASVFLAVHPQLRKEVVLKIGHQSITDRSSLAERICTEGRILARLDHPALARVYDLDSEAGYPFIVFEYVHGQTLDQVHERTPYSPAAAARLVAQVARAAAQAHRQHVVHQDIKPKNILIDGEGRPRLIDFGLASLQDAWSAGEETAPVVGTLQFMAPEQGRAGPRRSGAAADVYGLGGVLYYLLTGDPLHAGTSCAELLQNVAHNRWNAERLVEVQTPRRLQQICARALATDPADRYSSAEEMAKALEAIEQAPSRRRLLIGATIVLGAAFACGAAALSTLGGADRQPPGEPELAVNVWDGGRFVPLGELPLRSGDRLRCEGRLPAGCRAALLLFDSRGRWNLLQEWTAESQPRAIGYPAAGESVPLVAPGGTELLLLCVQRDEPVSLAMVGEVFPEGEPLRNVSPYTTLSINAQGVAAQKNGRGLGSPQPHDDPQGDVERRLKQLAAGLSERGLNYSGLAFYHR